MGNEAKLALEDGTVLKGEAFGYETVTVGELAFSTGMSGYTEALTDPSFKGQILMSTYPLEGNYGVSEEWYQSDKVQVEGFVVREACKKLSNFGTKKTLDDFLKEFKVPGIEDIDTRDLTLKIREKGSLKAALATEEIDDDELVARAQEHKSIIDLAILDCGVKKNIINCFLENDIGVALFPYDTDYQTILDYGVNGLMVSPGPGNPERLTDTIANVGKLINKFPVFGICMGQHVIAKTFGATTYKMKFGHRGANQPVKDLQTGKVFITSQNHGFAVDPDSLKGTDLELTQINLNDGTPEGFLHKELPLRTIQYHPESGPGPNDTRVLFEEFGKMIKEY